MGVEGQTEVDLEKIKSCIEHDIFAYQVHAGLFQHFDPYMLSFADFYATQKVFKEQARALSGGSDLAEHLDYASFEETLSNFDPLKPVYRRSGSDEIEYYYPPDFAKRVGKVKYKDSVREYPIDDSEKSIDIYVFEGETGASGGKGGSISPMGYVAYDKETEEVKVVFRGSRSGGGKGTTITAALLGVGSPDWVTDLHVVSEKFVEISEQGKFQPGFARTYLSCRESIIDILEDIHKQNPETKKKLTTTGHSLGGALATTMFVDVKCGRLKEKLAERINNDDVEKFLDGIDCVAVSAPGISDKEVIASLSDQDRKGFHKVYYEDDPVVKVTNQLASIKSTISDRLISLEDPIIAMSAIGDRDISLGRFGSGIVGYDFLAHDISMVHSEIQRRCNQDSQQVLCGILNEVDLLCKSEVAKIIEQFDVGYFLVVSMIMIEKITSDPERVKSLHRIIEEFGKLFHDKDVDPYADKKSFDLFVERLSLLSKSCSDDDLDLSRIGIVTKSEDYTLDFLVELGDAIDKLKQTVKSVYGEYPELHDKLSDFADYCNLYVSGLIESFSAMRGIDFKEDREKYDDAIKNAKWQIEKFQEFLGEVKIDKVDFEVSGILADVSELIKDLRNLVTGYDEFLKGRKFSGNNQNYKEIDALETKLLEAAAKIKSGLDDFNDQIISSCIKAAEREKTKQRVNVGSGIMSSLGSAISFIARTAALFVKQGDEYLEKIARKSSLEAKLQRSFSTVIKQLYNLYSSTDYESLCRSREESTARRKELESIANKPKHPEFALRKKLNLAEDGEAFCSDNKMIGG